MKTHTHPQSNPPSNQSNGQQPLIVIAAPGRERYRELYRFLAATLSHQSVSLLDAGPSFNPAHLRTFFPQPGGLDLESLLVENLNVFTPADANQVLKLLATPVLAPGPLILLDILKPFQNPAIAQAKREKQLGEVMRQIDRLRDTNPVVVCTTSKTSSWHYQSEWLGELYQLATSLYLERIGLPLWRYEW